MKELEAKRIIKEYFYFDENDENDIKDIEKIYNVLTQKYLIPKNKDELIKILETDSIEYLIFDDKELDEFKNED